MFRLPTRCHKIIVSNRHGLAPKKKFAFHFSTKSNENANNSNGRNESNEDNSKSDPKSSFFLQFAITFTILELSALIVLQQMNENKQFDDWMHHNIPKPIVDVLDSSKLYLRDKNKSEDPVEVKQQESLLPVVDYFPQRDESPVQQEEDEVVETPIEESSHEAFVSSDAFDAVDSSEMDAQLSTDSSTADQNILEYADSVSEVVVSEAISNASEDVATPSQHIQTTPNIIQPLAPTPPPIESDFGYIIPVVPSEVAAKTIQSDSISSALDELALQNLTLRREYEAMIAKDLESLDIQALRSKFIQVTSEYFERNRWEGIRLHQAMKQIENEVSRKYLELLRQQRNELESQSYEQILLKQKEWSDLIKLKEEEFKVQFENNVREKEKALVEELQLTMNNLKDGYNSQLQNELDFQVGRLRKEYNEKFTQTQNTIKELHDQLSRIYQSLDDITNNNVAATSVHKEAAAVLALDNALATSEPLEKYVVAVSEVTRAEDSLTTALIKSIPAPVLKRGAVTLPELKLRFAVAKNEARKAALVPEGVPSLFGNIIAETLGYLSWAPKGYVVGNGIEESLARAEFYLDQGKLHEALRELEPIQGFAGVLLSDWKELAKERMISEQITHTLRSNVILRHSSFSK